MKDYFTGVEFIRMSFKVQKHSEYTISSRSDTPISIKEPLCFLKKSCENFLSVEPGSGHKGKNFSNFWKHVFFANWAIENHLAEKNFFSRKKFGRKFSVSSHGQVIRAKFFSNFWKHVFFANWTI